MPIGKGFLNSQSQSSEEAGANPSSLTGGRTLQRKNTD
jgi:hypothetical protein